MIDARGDVLYVGKAKNIKKRIANYARPTAYDSRIERMVAATASLEFVSTKTETEALLLEANLIKRLRPRFNVLLRDDKSFPYILITGDHWAPQILKHRGARNRDGQLLRPVRLGLGGQPHHHGAAARVPLALLLRRLLREPHAAVPAASDQALLGALHARDRVRRLSGAGARGQRLPLRQEPGGEGGARRRDGERLRGARFRARRDLPRPPRRALGGDRAAGHQPARRRGGRRLRRAPGGRLLLRAGVLLPHRPELGQPRLFSEGRPYARPGRGVERLHRAVLRRQAGAGAHSRLARRSRTARCLEEALSTKSGRKVEIAFPRRGEKKELVDHAARQCARGAGPKARRHRLAAKTSRPRSPNALGLRASRGGSRCSTTRTSWARTRSAP